MFTFPASKSHLFCSYFQSVKDPITYFRLFDSPARYRVDSSHVYFSHPETAPILRALFPDARFIVTLRNPKNRAYSLYRWMRRHRHEDGEPFEGISDIVSALMAEDERYNSESFFKNCRQYFWNFMYCRSSLYDEQSTRFFSHFSHDRFHILTFAELASNPVAAMDNIASFLDIDPGPLPQIKIEVPNSGGPCSPYSAASDRITDQAFVGLTERTDRLVGRPLDWTL